MWHITISVTNLISFILGYVAGFATIVAWGIWLNWRKKKRIEQIQEEAYDEAVRRQFGRN